ncbi:hypothetical protein HGRIS_012616 [Hohenbuehelia grisea]|uniref:Scd6-like Sm domain-containing protein n=1 Tax=Hohenbuehelia grisea TaxID=104357 RepID=A0ABR3ISU4_9AGAR
MAASFIGKPISLTSHSDVRYRGILAGIDTTASTIQLSNVFSMGTENRRPPAEFIPPVQEPYQYIIFRAAEVKDLAIDEPVLNRSVHDDPAVLGAGSPATQNYGQFQGQAPPQAPPPQGQAPPQQAQAYDNQRTQQQPTAPGNKNTVPPQAQRGQQRGNVQTAAQSMETVERALSDLRVSNNSNASGPTGNRGGRRAGAAPTKEIKVPNTEFDFQGNNARFDKVASKPHVADGESDEEGGAGGPAAEPAYNPQKSFFDGLTSSTRPVSNGPRGGGPSRRGGPGMGRNRREEERQRNVATFGEPGGVGLMGPGAYVGGWGGYGRRGGNAGAGRGRRTDGVAAPSR